MRISTKGQVTIPEELRAKFNFLPGSEVNFVEKNGKVFLELQTDGQNSRFGKLRNIATTKMSTDEIMALTRG